MLLGFLGVVGLLAGGTAFGQEAVPGEVIVRFRPELSATGRTMLHRRHRGFVRDRISSLNVEVVSVQGTNAEETARFYRSQAGVASAEPNYITYATGTSSDPYLGYEWGMTKIQATRAWDIAKGDGIKIAILDTGIDQNHPELRSKIVANRNFTSSPTYDDMNGHGTHCAGTVAAVTNNGAGVAGLSCNSWLMNAKVLGDDGSGTYAWMINGIVWAVNNGAKVISMSLGGSMASQSLRDALSYAWNHGVVVVAAAGNSGSSYPSYPGYYPECIAVAATDSYDRRASFSNWGSWVDVAAPGVSVLSTLPTHANRIGRLNYGYLSGTSMATPFVAGLAGLIWSRSPYNTSASAVRTRIQSTCDAIPGTGSLFQWGRINAYRAVQ